MIIGNTLAVYLGKRFFWALLAVVGLLAFLVFTFEALDLIKRAEGRPHVTFGLIVQMALLKTPTTVQSALPFAVLFGGMFTLWRLTRFSELVVARAAGISAWQFLTPIVMVGAFMGLAQVVVINPLSALAMSEYRVMENRDLRQRLESLELDRNGLWLRETNPQSASYLVLHADSLGATEQSLHGVDIWLFGGDDGYTQRIEAERAQLRNGYFLIRDATIYPRQGPPRANVGELKVYTDIQFSTIADSLSAPETVGFWQMPRVIATLEQTGFSSTAMRLHMQRLLSQPILYAGMILLAAAFAMRQTRKGGTMLTIVAGLLTGFCLYMLRDVAGALGMVGSMPVLLASWTPAIAALLMGGTLLLFSEDG
ncbi:MAG: LPS export ABC transporter permease LptG [Alphaproteobacteria bacterium]